MTPPSDSPTSTSVFQQKIYLQLDQRLRESPWGSGASEAHGLLAGLACVGITADTIRTRAWLLQLSEPQDIEMLEGMFSLILRDLVDPGFGFNLMLPDESESLAERAEALSCWCQGFLQGAFHENTRILSDGTEESNEAITDIMEIGHIEYLPDDDPVSTEHDLHELEQFLRVAVQLVYDEFQPATSAQPSNTIN